MVGCLFFPVVWASEPARSGDETTPNRLAPLRPWALAGGEGEGGPLIGSARMKTGPLMDANIR